MNKEWQDIRMASFGDTATIIFFYIKCFCFLSIFETILNFKKNKKGEN